MRGSASSCYCKEGTKGEVCKMADYNDALKKPQLDSIVERNAQFFLIFQDGVALYAVGRGVAATETVPWAENPPSI